MKTLIKKAVPHFIAILVMLIVSSVYFSPAWEGKTLRRDDIVKSSGSNREKAQYQKYEGKVVLWNNAVFSGMPDFIGAKYDGATKLMTVWNIPQKLGVPTEVAFVFWYMLGFYILLVVLGVNPWLAMAGATSFGLTSYNLIIINAGHFMKVRTLALIPPVLGGVFLIFRRKYLMGIGITAFFLAMQIVMGHIQMSYYFLLGLVCIGFVELYHHIKNKDLVTFSKSLGVLLFAALLGIAPNYAKLSNLYRYNKQSIRGKSELNVGKEGVKTRAGLDRDYINSWSSGKAEVMMLFAPRVKGGASSYVKQDRDLLNKVDSRMRSTIGNMNQYWGNQPGSGGPNSAGAVIIFLFVIGIFVVKGPLKKGILISVVLFILLSLGRHFPAFTNIFIDYVPLYNKFRTPVSIMAVGVAFITFFAFYSIAQIIQKPELLEQDSKLKIGKKILPLYVAAGLGFMAFILLNIAFPNLLNTYFSDAELSMFYNYRAQGQAAQIDSIVSALETLRISVFRTEMFRVLMFSAAALISIILFQKEKLKLYAFIGILGVLSLIDVWGISSRYISKEDFTSKNLYEEEYKQSAIDEQIYDREIRENPALPGVINEAFQQYKPQSEEEKEDLKKHVILKNSFYRVYNLTTSSFQENVTSGAHNSIGGYSAAKLRRYQDLIEFHISKGNRQVLNMLNAKYLITQNGLQINQGVMGPAWFVNSVKWAKTPDQEIALLDSIDVSQDMVVHEKFKKEVGTFDSSLPEDTVSLEIHEPDYVVYNTSTKGNRLIAFSEIYYPDWTVLIDGKPVRYFEANYTLRGINVPKGIHKIEFMFKPDYYYKANSFSNVMFYLLLLVLLGTIVFEYRKRKKTSLSPS